MAATAIDDAANLIDDIPMSSLRHFLRAPLKLSLRAAEGQPPVAHVLPPAYAAGASRSTDLRPSHPRISDAITGAISRSPGVALYARQRRGIVKLRY